MYKELETLEKKFHRCYEYYQQATGNVTIHPLKEPLAEAGKLVFDKIVLDFSAELILDVRFEKEPTVKLSSGEHPDIPELSDLTIKEDFYGEYFICLVAESGRIGALCISNQKLLDIDLPCSSKRPYEVNWGLLLSDKELKSKYACSNKGFLLDLCLGAQKLCKLIRENLKQINKEWKHPVGYIGTNVIKEKYDISGSTLHGWVVRALKTGELLESDILQSPQWGRQKYYPEYFIETELKRRKAG